MIKIGISGAASPNAGELIRLLVNHPEVDIVALIEPEMRGRSAASVHHGLIGENIVNFTDSLTTDGIDLLFLTRRDNLYSKVMGMKESLENLKLVDLTANNEAALADGAYAIGLSEINRKNLVRTVKHAFIPSMALVLPLITLFPLANFMLLNHNLQLDLILPSAILTEVEKPDELENFMKLALNISQSSFNSEVNFSLEPSAEESRVIIFKTVLNSTLSLDEIEKIYDSIYDDHNFTFITHNPVSIKEVEGTQKCIISLNKPTSNLLELTTIADGRMRGGAGDAIHILNLLNGLHEKTGLHLKSSSFDSPGNNKISQWFA